MADILGFTQKGYRMDINSLNNIYTSGMAGVSMMNQMPQGQQNMNMQVMQQEQGKDAYVPSMMSMDMTFPTTNYGANGMMVGQMNQLPPVEGMQETSQTATDNNVSTDFMQTLQDAFRANADSIQSTMDELGLTMDDLADESNLTTLANAMNEGAEKIGVKTVDNLDEVVSNLVDQINGASADGTETSAVSGSSDSSGSSGSGSSSEDDETTTEIVTINGVTYLETTTTENGVEVTTRTVLGSTEEE